MPQVLECFGLASLQKLTAPPSPYERRQVRLRRIDVNYHVGDLRRVEL
jgi:hypothetical protein